MNEQIDLEHDSLENVTLTYSEGVSGDADDDAGNGSGADVVSDGTQPSVDVSKNEVVQSGQAMTLAEAIRKKSMQSILANENGRGHSPTNIDSAVASINGGASDSLEGLIEDGTSVIIQVDTNECGNHMTVSRPLPPKKIGYRDVEIAVSEFYTKQQFYSAAFDVMATYIKGQKILYTEAAALCRHYLDMLMLPAILLTALASVLSFSVDEYSWGAVTVASINAFNGFLLALVNYLKLDAAAEAHKICSHQYDKLQSMCEFTSGCLMVLPFDEADPSKKLNSNQLAQQKMEMIERKIKDIKEANSFIIPNDVRKRLINIYYTNIFSLVKKVNEVESKIIITMKELINLSRELEYKKKLGIITTKEVNELKRYNSQINNHHKHLIDVQSSYGDIDEMFKNDIKRSEKMKSRCYRIYRAFCKEKNVERVETKIHNKLKNKLNDIRGDNFNQQFALLLSAHAGEFDDLDGGVGGGTTNGRRGSAVENGVGK